MEVYYSYKLSQALVPVVATLPQINISPAIIRQSVINAAQQLKTSQTITADGTLITLPSATSLDGAAKVPINTIMANLNKIGDVIANKPTLPNTAGIPSIPNITIPDYHPRKPEESNRFATEKALEDTKYSIFHSGSGSGSGLGSGSGSGVGAIANAGSESSYTPDKPPFDGLDPKELLSRLNYIYYATAQPAKQINYHDFKTHADVLLDADGTKLSNDDPKLQSYAAGFYPQLTADQIDARDCLNYGSGPKSCFQSKQLFYNAAQNFNILDKGVNMENANLVVREDFSMPQNLEAIVSRPLPLDVADRNSARGRVLFVNAPKGNLDVPLDQESNETLGRKLNDSMALCHNCKLAVCKDDYCGLQNSLFM
jgi:hypothetical protein